jgi:hypothetical protein
MSHKALGLVLLSVVALISALARADEPLVRLDKLFDMGKAVVIGNAKVTLVPQGDGAVLHVEVPKGMPMVGVSFPAPQGKWDLSPYTHVFADVRNVGANLEQVLCRVDNPDANGDFNSTDNGVLLAPGQSGTIKVILTRKKPDWVKVDLFGMDRYPWGSEVPVGKSGRWCIDAANVTNLVIFVDKPRADVAFEIAGVRAIGRYVPPTELLKDPNRFFPFIDEYGQYIHADWPGKTHGPEDFAKRREAEAKDLSAHLGPAGWDQYGGWKDGPQLKATGWFYAAKHEGKWWLVDPEGKLFFSHGIDCVTAREGAASLVNRGNWFRNLPDPNSEFKGFYSAGRGGARGTSAATSARTSPTSFDFEGANLLRKYGNDWQTIFADLSHRRLRSWGLNTIGNWSDPAIYSLKRTPYTATVRYSSTPLGGGQGARARFRDVFDADFAPQVRQAMVAQAAKTAADPWCLGYFVDNELPWGESDVALAVSTLSSPAQQPAKRVFVEDLKVKYTTIERLNAAWGTAHASWDALLAATQPPDATKAHEDLVAFHAKTAETYFKTVRDAVKAADPNHLYLGCRFMWGITEPVVAAAAKYCDVVSYNAYQHSVTEFRQPVPADAPLIIGEFHFGALDRGLFHPGLVSAVDQAHRAESYKEYVRSVLRDGRFVGCHWFKYVDEPTTGRGDGENFQIGFLDIADTPYTETIDAAREVGAEMYQVRMSGK